MGASITMLHDLAREIQIVPIRHHSPACAAHLQRLIIELQPAAIVVEGPCDFDPLITVICDERTRPPVAIVALRDVADGTDGNKASKTTKASKATRTGTTRRAVSYFPLCAHSPELIALQAAATRNIPARFIDLPSTARDMLDDTGAPARSLLDDERVFDVGDYVGALARELGCRDGNEVWDQLFETRLAEPDWRRFFADVAQYCTCIRAATDTNTMAHDGTLAREAQMRALLAEVRAQVSGLIIVVVGGFHAEAVLEPAQSPPVAPGSGQSYLIRYGMKQLDALRGYGAGLPLPGFYDRLWQARESGGQGLARELISGFAAHLRHNGWDAPPFPVITNAVEQAERLAMLRGRPFPARDDILDAIRSSFIKDEIARDDVPLLVELKAWLTGSMMGDVPPSAGSPPLIEAVRAQARSMGFTVADGERRNRELDIYRKPRHRTASRFCHAMAMIGTDFAKRTAGPDFRHDVDLDRLFETWSVCWSPRVDARLIELSEGADTLHEALALVLAERLVNLSEQGRGRSALAAIDLFATACRAGLTEESHAVLALIATQIMEDPELDSLVAALTDLLLLRRSQVLLGIADIASLDRLITTTWRRVLILLPELADGGAERIRRDVNTLSNLRGMIELARSSSVSMDLALFDDALARLQAQPLAPMLAGAVMAFALIDGQTGPDALEARLQGELISGYVDVAERLAFLGGVIAIARELLWSVPAMISVLDGLVSGLEDADFTALLPHLRLALMPLDPREVERLAEEVAGRMDARQIAVTVDISEAEMAANLVLDRHMAALLTQDGVV